MSYVIQYPVKQAEGQYQWYATGYFKEEEVNPFLAENKLTVHSRVWSNKHRAMVLIAQRLVRWGEQE